MGTECEKDSHSACTVEGEADAAWQIAEKTWDEIEVGHECEEGTHGDCKCDNDGNNCKKEAPEETIDAPDAEDEIIPIEIIPKYGICEKKNY